MFTTLADKCLQLTLTLPVPFMETEIKKPGKCCKIIPKAKKHGLLNRGLLKGSHPTGESSSVYMEVVTGRFYCITKFSKKRLQNGKMMN